MNGNENPNIGNSENDTLQVQVLLSAPFFLPSLSPEFL